jgi:HPt (histidine-containing phosphotransfer) domain-containing protein
VSQIYNLSYLQEVSKGNIAFMLDMIHIFLTKTPETLDLLKKEVETSNWEMVGFYAHKLKATYAYMGMLELKELLVMIEKSAKQMENLHEIPIWFSSVYKSTQPALIEISEHKQLLEKAL